MPLLCRNELRSLTSSYCNRNRDQPYLRKIYSDSDYAKTIFIHSLFGAIGEYIGSPIIRRFQIELNLVSRICANTRASRALHSIFSVREIWLIYFIISFNGSGNDCSVPSHYLNLMVPFEVCHSKFQCTL